MRRCLIGLAIFAIAVPVPLKARAGDHEIMQEIVKNLEDHKSAGDLKDFNIGLQVEDGSVFFKGSVASPEQERLALEAARAVAGVKLVINEMTIAKDTSAASADTQPAPEPAPEPVPEPVPELAPAALDAPLKENGLRPASGRRTETERDTAQPKIITAELTEAAEAAPVLVSQTSSRDAISEAREIAAEIIGQFRLEKEQGNLRRFGIDVEVERGTVWLKGHVASEQQEALALEIARQVPGVRQVHSELEITAASLASVPAAPSLPTDSQIANEIALLLKDRKESGELRNFGIEVQVEMGTVWMTGYVGSESQRQMALNIARYTVGVEQVVDDLSVSTGPVAPVSRSQPVPMSAQPVYAAPPSAPARHPMAYAPAMPVNHQALAQAPMSPVPMMGAAGSGVAAARFDHPHMPGHAWPSYASYPNYGAVTYPKQYSPAAWPYIGPFYPYPQVPLGWRKVTLEWDDGWWFLDFKDRH